MLKYSILCRKNPVNSDVKFYAQLESPEPLTLDQIAENIANNCTLTRHDIVACLSAFQEQMVTALRDGRSVRLNDLGCFRVTAHSIGTVTEDAFTTGNIHKLSIRFTPASRLRKQIQVGAAGISFSKVKPAVIVNPTDPKV